MLTERDQTILEALCLKVRMFSLEQLAECWWGGNTPTATANARRRLRKLQTMGFVEPWQVKAHPLLDLKAPVASWSLGDPEPDPWAVSYQLQCRWTEAPKTTTVWIAAKGALHHFGSVGRRFGHPLQATHDLHVSAIYLRMHGCYPALATTWVGEDELATSDREKLPDAVLLDALGRKKLFIEFGGAYPAKRVENFHEHCLAEGLPYQLW
jgi:hypothetical protein